MEPEVLAERTFDLYRQLPKYPAYVKKGPVTLASREHDISEPVTLVSIRQAITEGRRPISIALKEPYVYHILQERSQGTWMTTQLQEICQMVPVYDAAYGNVLIGGLGLGAISHLLCQKALRVTVVEKNANIIRLIKPYIHPGIIIVNEDLFSFVKNTQESFDYGFFDIWQLTNQSTWFQYVMPLRRLAYGKIKTLDCWQEAEMTGSMGFSLYKACDMPEDSLWDQHKHFRRGTAKIRGEARIASFQPTSEWMNEAMKLEVANREDKEVIELINLYTTQVGTPEWERIFG